MAMVASPRPSPRFCGIKRRRRLDSALRVVVAPVPVQVAPEPPSRIWRVNYLLLSLRCRVAKWIGPRPFRADDAATPRRYVQNCGMHPPSLAKLNGVLLIRCCPDIRISGRA